VIQAAEAFIPKDWAFALLLKSKKRKVAARKIRLAVFILYWIDGFNYHCLVSQKIRRPFLFHEKAGEKK
jgi:hypothetical protein